MRSLALEIRGRLGDRPGVVAVVGTDGDKAAIVVVANDAAQARGLSANDLVRLAGEVLGGRGGGKADIAQGGGTEVGRVGEALQRVEQAVGEAAGRA